MTRAAIAEARAFESWHDYQAALKRAIAPLTSAQLQRRLLPGLRTPGEIAEHIVFGRALHLHRTLGERAAELTSLLRWEDPDDPPHTAAEIVHGLELTWQFITVCLMRGSPTDAVPECVFPIRSAARCATADIGPRVAHGLQIITRTQEAYHAR